MAGRAARILATVAVGVLALGGAVGCSGGNGDASRPGDGAGRASEVAQGSPFTLPTPAGAKLRSVGAGVTSGVWGSDTSGNDSPVTVLRRVGGGAPIVLAGAGYTGMEGGLEQALPGYPEQPTVTEIDGHRALVASGGRGAAIVDFGPDLAVVAHGEGATDDELVEVLRHVEPDPRHGPPSLTSVPDGFEVQGRVTVPAVVSLHSAWRPEPGFGGWGARTRMYSMGDGAFAVLTLPSTAADLSAVRWAIPGYDDQTLRDRTVAGRPALVVQRPTETTIVTHSSWGDLLVLSASGGDRAPIGADVLAALAGQVERTSDAPWAAEVVRTQGPRADGDPVADVKVTRDPSATPDPARSAPFVVGWVPEGVLLKAVSTDRDGLEGAATVLARIGAPDRTVIVSIFPADRFADGPVADAPVTVEASWGSPGASTARFVRDNVEVTVSGDATEKELRAIAGATEVDGDRPPKVRAPAGFVAAGTATGSGRSAMVTGLYGGRPAVGPRALALRFQSGIYVSTVPVAELDDAAARAFAGGSGQNVKVDQRPGWIADDGLTLVSTTAWGDRLIVTLPEALDSATLVRIAASVERVDAATWDRVAATAPPANDP
jgi:hypothetical protein